MRVDCHLCYCCIKNSDYAITCCFSQRLIKKHVCSIFIGHMLTNGITFDIQLVSLNYRFSPCPFQDMVWTLLVLSLVCGLATQLALRMEE